MADNTKPQKIWDVPTVHEVYANQFISAGFDGSSVTLQLGTSRLMPEKMGEGIKDGAQPGVYVTARLAISAAAMVELITNITGMLDKIGIMKKPGGTSGSIPAPSQLTGEKWGRS